MKIKLENAAHRTAFLEGTLKADKVEKHGMDAVVDTGAVMLALPKDVVEVLNLREERKVVVSYADDRKETLPVHGPVFIELEGRSMTTECVVLPPTPEALIGQIVLKSLDFIADCQNQTLGPRPESPIYPMLNLK